MQILSRRWVTNPGEHGAPQVTQQASRPISCYLALLLQHFKIFSNQFHVP